MALLALAPEINLPSGTPLQYGTGKGQSAREQALSRGAFEQQITTQRIKDSSLYSLCWITWAFSIRGVTQSKVFRLVAEEMLRRGLRTFKEGD